MAGVVDGPLCLPPGFSGKPAAADLHVTPDGKFLYASERTSSTIRGFRVDPAGGALAAVESIPTEAHPRGFSIGSSIKDYPMGRNPNWVEIVDVL